MHAPAKRYLRTREGYSIPKSATEAECVEILIMEHRRSSAGIPRLTWFGRLLWKLFGRWL